MNKELKAKKKKGKVGKSKAGKKDDKERTNRRRPDAIIIRKTAETSYLYTEKHED